jgi:hypothetical protein
VHLSHGGSICIAAEFIPSKTETGKMHMTIDARQSSRLEGSVVDYENQLVRAGTARVAECGRTYAMKTISGKEAEGPTYSAREFENIDHPYIAHAHIMCPLETTNKICVLSPLIC